MAWREDLTGQTFGRFTVMRFDSISESGRRKWMCRCECGNERSIAGGNLKSGNTTSCGCFRSEINGQRFRELHTTHGQSRTQEYNQYRSIIARCEYSGAGNYMYYGARGIKVCERWRMDGGFVNFVADMGPRPSPAHSVERRDSDGNYEPSNCYWATPEQQAQNKRNTVLFTFNGEQMSLRRACRLGGRNYDLVLNRVHRGWDVEKAFYVPVILPGERVL